MKHTKGPWNVVSPQYAEHYYVEAKGALDGYKSIARIELFVDENQSAEDTRLANAHLIASAPDMLAELKLIQAELLEQSNADAGLASRLYRIIAKAEGRLKADEYYIKLAREHYGSAVRDNRPNELIMIGKLIDSGKD